MFVGVEKRTPAVDHIVTCDWCQTKAIVLRYIYKPDDIAEIERLFPNDKPIAPYMIVNCPRCGIRAIDPPSPRWGDEAAS
jgi:hypothetical protein